MHGNGIMRGHGPLDSVLHGESNTDNTTHVPTAGSSAALTKPNHTPNRHPRARAKGKIIGQCVLIRFSHKLCARSSRVTPRNHYKEQPTTQAEHNCKKYRCQCGKSNQIYPHGGRAYPTNQNHCISGVHSPVSSHQEPCSSHEAESLCHDAQACLGQVSGIIGSEVTCHYSTHTITACPKICKRHKT